jgi:hypothetical protein
MNWRERIPPAFVRMFSIFHQDVWLDNPSLDELANGALAHLKAEEREGVRDFMTELLASGVTRGELRTLMKKAGVRDVALTNPLPLFELIRDKLGEPEDTKKERRRAALIAAVREILLRDWDPVGIADIAPADEYDAYIGGVVKLIGEKASPDKIVRHLREIAETQMGIAGDKERTWRAAEKLAALVDQK